MMNQINVVPYIDVTLVLLVIFMVTAPMTNPGVVDLPKVGQTLKQSQVPPVVLTVKLNNKIELDNKPMERDELLLAVRQALAKSPERSVVIAADKNVKYDDVIGVMDLLKQNKVDKVGLLLSPAR
jgi:biopolymer transport protein TolR